MKKLFIFVIASITSAVAISAQNITFRASANKVVEVGENFRLNFSVNATGSNFTPPNMNDFRVLAGPSTSTSTNISVINGKATQNISNTYSYIIQGKKEGKFTIGSAKITVDGKVYESTPMTIQVIKGSATDYQSSNNNSNSRNLQGEVFLRGLVNKTTVYQGEPLKLSFKIYQKDSRISDFDGFEPPKLTGFWTKEPYITDNVVFEREVVNNKIYHSSLLWRSTLYPQKSGNLTIDPFKLGVVVSEKVGQQRDIFGRIVDVHKPVKKELLSPRRTIKVLPLPPNKPVSFSGAVGTTFKFNIGVDRQQLKSNESITLKVNVSGNGNFKVIDKVNIDFPATFEVFDPKVSNTDNSKTWEYLVIPREPGKYTIPKASFSYFDVNSKSYKTLISKKFDFDIAKGEDNQLYTTNNGGLTKEDVKTLGTDIRHIVEADFELKQKNQTFFGSLGFYLFYIISIAIFLAVIFVLRKQIKQNKNIALQKNKKANKISKKRLKEAANHMKQGNKEAFYDEVIKALWGYLSDKLSIPVADLSRDTVKETFANRNIDEEIINNFVEVIDNCEFAKYAPASAENQIEQDYDKARKTINKLVNVLS